MEDLTGALPSEGLTYNDGSDSQNPHDSGTDPSWQHHLPPPERAWPLQLSMPTSTSDTAFHSLPAFTPNAQSSDVAVQQTGFTVNDQQHLPSGSLQSVLDDVVCSPIPEATEPPHGSASQTVRQTPTFLHSRPWRERQRNLCYPLDDSPSTKPRTIIGCTSCSTRFLSDYRLREGTRFFCSLQCTEVATDSIKLDAYILCEGKRTRNVPSVLGHVARWTRFRSQVSPPSCEDCLIRRRPAAEKAAAPTGWETVSRCSDGRPWPWRSLLALEYEEEPITRAHLYEATVPCSFCADFMSVTVTDQVRETAEGKDVALSAGCARGKRGKGILVPCLDPERTHLRPSENVAEK